MKLKNILIAFVFVMSSCLAACGGDPLENDAKALNAIMLKARAAMTNVSAKSASSTGTNEETIKSMRDNATVYEDTIKDLKSLDIKSEEIKKIRDKAEAASIIARDGFLSAAKSIENNDNEGAFKGTKSFGEGAQKLSDAMDELTALAKEKKINLPEE